MNVRKIPLSLEVAFWNIVISILTKFKSIRSYSHTSPAATPSLKEFNRKKSYWEIPNSSFTKIKAFYKEIKVEIYQVCFWAILGFVSGFLFGLLIGF